MAPAPASRRFSLDRILLASIVLGFTVLILGGYGIWRARAPIPERTTTDAGAVLFTASDIRGGQALYQKHGLMEWGSVLGHGTYYGADFTAETLHQRVLALREVFARERGAASYALASVDQSAAIDAEVKRSTQANRYDERTGELALSAGEAEAFAAVEGAVRTRFVDGEPSRALPKGTFQTDASGDGRWIAPGDPIHQLAAFFWWTSWLASAERPGTGASYTNEWPYDPDAGNELAAGAILWSGVSVAALIGVLAVVILIWYRGRFEMEEAPSVGRIPATPIDWLPVFPSQRKTIKYFVTAGALFLVQALLGGYLAHYYVEGGGFYGFELARVLPFTVAKTWHLQLAIFWIATAWMGMGLYVAPLVGGGEPKHQGKLVDLLYGALVFVAVGSLAGEWLGVTGKLGSWWWWLGHSGWELVELGYAWKILLAAGFGLWLACIWRATRGALAKEHGAEGWGLARLFLASAVAIPAMFTAAFLITPGSHLTMADYWRWWVIHLWVEGMFEVFAVVVLGVLMVNMGLVTRSSAVRSLKFQLAILLGAGVIGIGHHYYWIGAPGFWIGLGSVFSALEVVPLALLAVEAWQQWRVIRAGGESFVYKHTFRFLMAVAFWNLVGAGVFGFLINLPAVSYFEHGSFLTANHGHTATMGVFGMLAIALALYCVRNVATERGYASKLFTLSFWGLNVGLAGMAIVTLFPVGVMQMMEAMRHGFWAARSVAFYHQPVVHTLLWLRIVPDSIFIGLGVVPLFAGLTIAWRNLRPVTPIEDAVRVASAPRREPSLPATAVR
ncbi:MAG: cbb3-type cytochrome c oxidase subunit I [Planctomycetes bacterium]|nr:cbb3-type cytochrome c oxidase subunit I [Planctomycetota bacterium]